MARVPTKHGRDQAYDFQGFLNDLQDWEANLKDKDKKFKGAATSETNVGLSGRLAGKTSVIQSSRSTSGKYDYSTSLDSVSRLSSFSSEDNDVDAASEKELGNEYFKQKKFKEAAECYSRSIALLPTAVAYANRAMAYLKMKRQVFLVIFSVLLEQCSYEYSEFALKLEPNNQEIKKQLEEVKSLHEKRFVEKASEVVRNSLQAAQKGGRPETKVSPPAVHVVSSDSDKVSASHKDKTKEKGKVLAQKSISVEEVKKKSTGIERRAAGLDGSDSYASATRAVQVTSPVALPQIFKNALSVPMLVDIIKCIATFFSNDTDLAVKYLENLTKVPRFGMLIMCLSSADKADLHKIWDEVFSGEAASMEHAEILNNLRPKYYLK
ncbi:hypothetical protein Tsubulata_045625 [Turnera subulata]|uniref:RNA-polymerase II-associated protein 3-like C-terminal domain-containing protein n=1 Tax=Turnera subulata TaxID=218843 RepID=A0A9Q0GA11_9ROSI|nr:hypothetical protein Tsubulata_045625 [Turnera subulata]